MERFLYRLSKSASFERFILKGALLLTAWRAPQSRPTMDIDLAGRTSNELDHIAELVGAVCEVVAEPDGIEFNRASIEVSKIKEDADYEGVRVRFHAILAKARIPLQIDIGFGDVIVPGPTEVEYPTLLDFPAGRRESRPLRRNSLLRRGKANRRDRVLFYGPDKTRHWSDGIKRRVNYRVAWRNDNVGEKHSGRITTEVYAKLTFTPITRPDLQLFEGGAYRPGVQALRSCILGPCP